MKKQHYQMVIPRPFEIQYSSPDTTETLNQLLLISFFKIKVTCNNILLHNVYNVYKDMHTFLSVMQTDLFYHDQ